MRQIAIHLFGPVAVTVGADRAELTVGRSALRLLAYLSLHATPLPREVIMAELWPDSDDRSVRSRLSTALWRLRTALDGAGARDLLRDGGDATVGLDAAALDAVDTRRFERRAQAFLADPGDRGWTDAAADDRGRGVPMAGWYDVWALSARLRIEDLRERCLTELLDRQFAAGEEQPAIATAEKLLGLDPLREDVHQTLMRIYARQGRPSLAVRQYERCRQTLSAELDVEPAEETRALRAALGRRRRGTAPIRAAGSGDLREFREELAEAQHGLARLSSMIDTMLER